MENEREQGMFWLPHDPEKRVVGVVTLNAEGGTRLTTYGQLDHSVFEGSEQVTIQGEIASSYIKLVNCFPTNPPMFLMPSQPMRQIGTANSRSAETTTKETYQTASSQLKQSLRCSETGCQVSKG